MTLSERLKRGIEEPVGTVAYGKGYSDACSDVIDDVLELESTNAALTKRVAELEASVAFNRHWFEQAANNLARVHELQQLTTDLQSQLAWTPVEKGLPTEPGFYFFVEMSGGGVLQYLMTSQAEVYSDNELTEFGYTHYRCFELPAGFRGEDRIALTRRVYITRTDPAEVVAELRERKMDFDRAYDDGNVAQRRAFDHALDLVAEKLGIK